jgi:ureidoglycolate lyase
MTAPRFIHPRPLTRDAFAPFGDVIDEQGDRSHDINRGTSRRFDDLARIEMAGDRSPQLSIFRCQGTISLPYRISQMECHPLGSQAFIPRAKTVFLVVVAPPGAFPEVDRIEAFLTDGDQGVNYRPGAWHVPLASLSPASFLVIDRGEDEANCLVHPFGDVDIAIG